MKRKIIKICLILMCVAGMFSLIGLSAGAVGDTAYTYLQEIDRSFSYRVSDITKNPDNSNKVRFGEWIKEKLKSFGYQPFEESFTHSNGTPVTDIIARKQGRSAKRIVIGAHYDSVDTKGVEDNGTGVAALLELAQTLSSVDTPCTIDFCFFDGEETLGYAGSYIYMLRYNDGNILCNINLDCIGSGDRLYAASGEYEKGTLQRVWPLNMAAELALQNGIELNVIPEVVSEFPTPTMVRRSDQFFFNQNKIPYLYLFTNAWVKGNGEIGNPEHTHLYNSALPAFQSTNGQIVHKAEFEDLKTLESLTGSTLRNHMRDTLKLVISLAQKMDESSSSNFNNTSWEKLKKEAAVTAKKTSEEINETKVTEATRETAGDVKKESETSEKESNGEMTESASHEEATSGNEEETETKDGESKKDDGEKSATIQIISLSLIGISLLLAALIVCRIIHKKRKTEK